MYTTFAFALFASFVAAQGASNDNPGAAFAEWAAKYGKSYPDVGTWSSRQQVFVQSSATVAALNAEAQAKGQSATFALNRTADLTDDEYRAMLGLDLSSEDEFRRELKVVEKTTVEGHGRRLQSSNVDWQANGILHPVKDQGPCGSCWAFSASGAFEAALAIKGGYTQQGEGATPWHISEQQAVDCVLGGRYGCVGGLMAPTWDYWMSNAAVGDDVYPYTATQGSCRTSFGSVRKENVVSHGRLGQSNAEMVSNLQNAPLAVAVSAGNNCWRYYSGGIVTPSMNCSTSLDHAVVIAAYYEPAGIEETCTLST